MPRRALLSQPIRGLLKPLGQQLNVKDFFSIVGFLLLQKIDQERGQAALLENFGDVLVAGAESAAAAAVRKHHDAFRMRRNMQDAIQIPSAAWDPNLALLLLYLCVHD